MAKATAEKNYVLTQQEYETVCENFYEAQSLVRMLRAASSPELEGGKLIDLDVEYVCNIILGKLKTIEPYLGK